MPNLNLKDAEQFVKTQRRLGNIVRWEGWDMVFWKPTRHGFTNVNGAYDKKRERWGVETRVMVNDEGTYKIPAKHVKTTR